MHDDGQDGIGLYDAEDIQRAAMVVPTSGSEVHLEGGPPRRDLAITA